MTPTAATAALRMAMAMRRLGFGDEGTVHGFRQCLSTWAREHTRYRIDTIEAALAHRDEDKVARAYSHAAYYWQERRALAEEWAKFCTTPPRKNSKASRKNVVPIRARA
jgi:integrase